ncbi:MAG: GNAT family N-acetyltransferase [Spirochaetes bacterium]|nr:GNAT family N-acetyltransferase [Spirochaetota bacterium]
MLHYYESIEDCPGFSLDGYFVGWKKPLSNDEFSRLLRNSAHVVLAVDDTARQIVGVVTALSDEVNWAFIPFLEVLPQWRGQGIGRALMERMLDKLADITCVDLTCDAEMQPFYAKFGMLPSCGAVVRRYL